MGLADSLGTHKDQCGVQCRGPCVLAPHAAAPLAALPQAVQHAGMPKITPKSPAPACGTDAAVAPESAPRHSAPAGGRGAIAGAARAFRQQGIPFKLIGSFLHANKIDGFDCPGCAFPDRPGKPLLDSCEQGQKAIAWEMTRKAVGAEFFEGKTPEQLQALGDFDLEFQGRLTTPILYEREHGRFRAIDWDSACAAAACGGLLCLGPQQQ
jgi:hypothetical protein